MIISQTYARVNNKSPEQVFNWWLNLDSEKYCQWFPDHINWIWKGKKPENENNLGRKVFIHEMVDGFEFKFDGKLVEVEPNSFLLFKHSFLPLSFSFQFEPSENGTDVIFTLNAGFKGMLGWIFDPIIRVLNGKNLKKSHVVEEHKMLESIL